MTIDLLSYTGTSFRIALAMASFRLTCGHNSAIHLLLKHGEFPSAQALIRPTLETGLRTAWLARTPKETIDAIQKGRNKFPLLGELVKSMGKKFEILLPGKFRGILDGLAHGTRPALGEQFNEGDKLDRSCATIYNFATTALAVAGYTMAELLGQSAKMRDFVREVDRFE